MKENAHSLVPDEDRYCPLALPRPDVLQALCSFQFLGTGFLVSSLLMCLPPPHCSEKASWLRGSKALPSGECVLSSIGAKVSTLVSQQLCREKWE